MIENSVLYVLMALVTGLGIAVILMAVYALWLSVKNKIGK